MVNTVVEICNMALVRLGASRITSLTDDSKQAVLCNLNYDIVRDEVLRDHDWNCAVERQQLSQLSETPAFGYDFVYSLPTNPFCLRVIEADDPDKTYRIEGRKLYTNEEIIGIMYVKRIIDPTQFDSQIIRCISLLLAAEISASIVQKQSIRQDLFQEYLIQLNKAKARDAAESKDVDEEDQSDWWEKARETADDDVRNRLE